MARDRADERAERTQARAAERAERARVRADAEAAKAARRVERIAETVVAKVDRASAELARKAAQLDEISERLSGFDLWLRPEPGTRKPRLSREDIAAAAVRIADTEGFDALSMRRLAAELDAGTMTLYHYVWTKDELLALVSDHVMGELLVPPGELPAGWRAALTMIARRSRDVLGADPWVFETNDEPAIGPNGTRHFDQSMQAVASLDVPLGDRFELVSAVDEYVFGFCLSERSNRLQDGAGTKQMLDYLSGLVAAGDLPAIAAMLDEHGVQGAWDTLRDRNRDPGRFDRNLGRLLDGFEADFARRAR